MTETLDSLTYNDPDFFAPDLRIGPADRRSGTLIRFPDIDERRRRQADQREELAIDAYPGSSGTQFPEDVIDTVLTGAPVIAHENLIIGRRDRYFHTAFSDQDNPALAKEAWRIHAEGYFTMGFVKEGAVTEEGYLTEDIDHARGPMTEYRLAINPDKETDCASMRKIGVTEDGDYKELPAYGLCKDALSPLGIAMLENIRTPGARLKEIAALARSKDAHPLAVHEIFRDVVHDAMGKDEVWFFSIVTTTFDSLTKSFGDKNFIVIGDDVPIEDERVSESVALRPAILYPDRFIDTMLDAYQEAESTKDRFRIMKSFMFFTEGLDESQMSPPVLYARNEILSASAAKALDKSN